MTETLKGQNKLPGHKDISHLSDLLCEATCEEYHEFAERCEEADRNRERDSRPTSAGRLNPKGPL